MKNLWSISLLVLLVAGCVVIKPGHVRRQQVSVTRDTGHVTRDTGRVTRYSPPLSSYLFKATLDIKKHHLTGLLVIKRVDTPPPAPPLEGRGADCSGIYRIVFMNEIGMTFFDLEMTADSFKVVSCFESLNKKSLMKIFETDFRVLNGCGKVKNEKIYRQEISNNLVVSAMAGRCQTWQTWSPAGDTLYATAAKSDIADPVIITYEKYKEGFPVKITLENPFIGMKLSLRKLVQ